MTYKNATPKFSVGYELLSCSTFFGKTWAQETFGVAAGNYFLIGKIENVVCEERKKPRYEVRFNYDNSKYTWSEKKVMENHPITVLEEPASRDAGFVVIPGGLSGIKAMAKRTQTRPTNENPLPNNP